MDKKLLKDQKSLVLSGLLLLIFFLHACSSSKLSENKVIVVHVRGLTQSDLTVFLDTSKTAGFFDAYEKRGFIHQLSPIINAVTICNIASFETGAVPSEHGIVGHSFGLRTEGSIQSVSGFAQRYLKETFWEKADKAGKKVLNVGALTLHGKYERHTNVDCLAQGEQLSAASLLTLIPNVNEKRDSLLPYTDLEGLAEISFQGPDTTSFFAYLIKRTSGSEELVLDDDLQPENGIIEKLKKGDWMEFSGTGSLGIKEAFRLVWLSSSGDTLNLYKRGRFRNRGYPPAFLQRIDNNPGPSKGWPNIPLYAEKKISESILMEEINSERDYVMNVFTQAVQEKEYDLVMLDYPIMDRLGHAFLYEKETSGQIQKYFREALERMDRDFLNIEKFAAENGYELIITSGHGFSPIHTTINVQQLFEKNKINSNTEVANWEAIGIPGKVSAHVYINDQLDADQRAIITGKIEKAFADLEAPGSSERVIDQIYRKDELHKIGLEHENSGDLYVLLRPGYVFQNSGSELFGVPLFKGDHGYSPDYESSHGVLITKDSCEPCLSVDVAGMILRKLDLNSLF